MFKILKHHLRSCIIDQNTNKCSVNGIDGQRNITNCCLEKQTCENANVEGQLTMSWRYSNTSRFAIV